MLGYSERLEVGAAAWRHTDYSEEMEAPVEELFHAVNSTHLEVALEVFLGCPVHHLEEA